MIAKHKALAVAVFGTWIAVAPLGCSSQLGGSKSNEHVVQTEDGGEEEDLTEAQEDPERDEFGRPKEDQQAGFWMSAAYLGMTVASSLLPFLMLL